MKAYVVDSSGIVVNVIMVGDNPVPPDGCTLEYLEPNFFCDIGMAWADRYELPPDPPIVEEVV
jgi:hypothetical protein